MGGVESVAIRASHPTLARMLVDSLVSPLAAFLAPASPIAPAPAPQFHGQGEVRTTIHVGSRWLDDDFEPAEEQLVLGVSLDVREPAARVGFEAGYFYSIGDGSTRVDGARIEADSCIHELWMGGRWNFDPFDGPVRPYVGVGASVLNAEFETKTAGDSDANDGWAFGLYGHAGVAFELGSGWSVGLDLRTLYTTKATLQRDVALDNLQGAIGLSWTW